MVINEIPDRKFCEETISVRKTENAVMKSLSI